MNPAERNKSKVNKAANLAADLAFSKSIAIQHPDFLLMTKRRRIWLNRQQAARVGARVGYAYANLVLFRASRLLHARWYAAALTQNGVFYGDFVDFNLKKK